MGHPGIIERWNPATTWKHNQLCQLLARETSSILPPDKLFIREPRRSRDFHPLTCRMGLQIEPLRGDRDPAIEWFRVSTKSEWLRSALHVRAHDDVFQAGWGSIDCYSVPGTPVSACLPDTGDCEEESRTKTSAPKQRKRKIHPEQQGTQSRDR